MTIEIYNLDTFARTIYGEARGEPELGRSAVAHVILNRWRAAKGRKTIADVCLAPKQFSCWNEGDPNRRELVAITLEDRTFRACMITALQAFDGVDPTIGARHYCTIDSEPSWAKGHDPVKVIGNHKFFVGIA